MILVFRDDLLAFHLHVRGQQLWYQLMGLDEACGPVAPALDNACGIHIHVGAAGEFSAEFRVREMNQSTGRLH